ncbi:MAG: 3-oxoacyl-ACP reductase FabG [Spirochaetota bacterium]|nr:MAG: 3-oxoacyl-ACP reductase FabG [Spirochaetota bacterium]
MGKLEGKNAIVTGSSYGIGKAIAVLFAKAGASVVVNYSKSEEKALNVVSEITSIGSKAIAVKADVSKSIDVKNMVNTCVETFGTIDILVNNAGILAFGTIEEISDEFLEEVLAVNYKGTFYCCRETVPIMKKKRYGKIVNISSIAGQRGDHASAPCYGSSKGAMSVLTKSLARQLGPFGINVNAIAPHAIITPMMDYWDEKKRDQMKETIPIRRLGTPEDVAYTALFLVSDEASFITGQIINLNGGYLMDS